MNDGLNRDVFIENREIDLKDMLFFICKKWRWLLLAAAAVMVLLPLVKIPALLELSGAGVILKRILKYAIIGVLSGLAVAFIVCAVLYIMNGKIKSENEFKTNCRINILGVLPKVTGKKPGGADRLVRRMFGVDRQAKDFDALTERLVEEIKAVLSVKGAEKNDGKAAFNVGVVSSESDKTAKMLVELIGSQLKGAATISSAGDVLKSGESIRKVMKADVVLMAERIGLSKYRMVEESYKKLTEWGKDIIGVVLMDGDAR